MLNTKIIEEAEDQFGLESSLSLLHYLTKQQYMEMYYDNLYTESGTGNANDDDSEDANDPNRKGSDAQSNTPKQDNKQRDIVDSNRHDRRPQDPTNKMNPKSQPASASGQMNPSQQNGSTPNESGQDQQQQQQPENQQQNEEDSGDQQQQGLGAKIAGVISKIWSFIAGIFQKLVKNIQNFLKGNDPRVQQSDEPITNEQVEFQFNLEGRVEDGPPISFEGGEQQQGGGQETSQPDTFNQSTGDNNSERRVPPTEEEVSSNIEKNSKTIEELTQRMDEMEKTVQELTEENKRLKEINDGQDNGDGNVDDEVDEQEIAENEQKANWLSQLLDRVTEIKNDQSQTNPQTNQAPIGDGNTVTLTQDQFERIIQSITSSQSQQAPSIQGQSQQVPQQPLPSGQNAMASLMSTLGIGAGSSGDMSQSSIITAGQNNDLIVRINELEEQLRRSQELTNQMQQELQQQRQQQQQQQQQGGNNNNQSPGGVQQLAQTLGITQQQPGDSGRSDENQNALTAIRQNLIRDTGRYIDRLNNLNTTINNLLHLFVNGGTTQTQLNERINTINTLVTQLRASEVLYANTVNSNSNIDNTVIQTVNNQLNTINNNMERVQTGANNLLNEIQTRNNELIRSLSTAQDRITEFDNLRTECVNFINEKINSPFMTDDLRTQLTNLQNRFNSNSELSQHVETLRTAIANPDTIQQNSQQTLTDVQTFVDTINQELNNNSLNSEERARDTLISGGVIRYTDIPEYYRTTYPAEFSIEYFSGKIFVKIKHYLLPNIGGVTVTHGTTPDYHAAFTTPIETFCNNFNQYINDSISLENDINARLTAARDFINQHRNGNLGFKIGGNPDEFRTHGYDSQGMIAPGITPSTSPSPQNITWADILQRMRTISSAGSPGVTGPPFGVQPIIDAIGNRSNWIAIRYPELRTELNAVLGILTPLLEHITELRTLRDRRAGNGDLATINQSIGNNNIRRRLQDTGDPHRDALLWNHIAIVDNTNSTVTESTSQFLNSYIEYYIDRICSIGEICDKCIGGTGSNTQQFGAVGTSALANRTNDYLHRTGRYAGHHLDPVVSDEQINTERRNDVSRMVNVIRSTP